MIELLGERPVFHRCIMLICSLYQTKKEGESAADETTERLQLQPNMIFIGGGVLLVMSLNFLRMWFGYLNYKRALRSEARQMAIAQKDVFYYTAFILRERLTFREYFQWHRK